MADQGSLPQIAAPVETTSPAHINLANSLVPFPGHWDGHLRINTENLFKAQLYDEAIRDATLRLETRLRELCGLGPEVYGLDLVNAAFRVDGGFLEQTGLVRTEREGLQSLFRGAVQQIRNPLGHRRLGSNPFDAFDMISVINYLLSVANQAVLTRYVYPFVGRWSSMARIIESVNRCDINADGKEEILVLMRWSDPEKGPHSGMMVLNSDGTDLLRGAIKSVQSDIVNAPLFEDIDGDGNREVLFSAGMKVDGIWQWRLVILDFDEQTEELNAYASADEEVLSWEVPFEILRPANVEGFAVAAMTPQRSLRFWQLKDGQFRPVGSAAPL